MMSEWFWIKINRFVGWMTMLALFVLVLYTANVEIKDFDLWLHIAMGKFISTHQYIPSVDVLSCTVDGKPWVNHEWLFQWLVYNIFNAWGADGLISMQVIVVGFTLFLLLFFGYRKDFQLVPLVALLLVFLTYQLRFTIRPDIFSLLFFVVYIRILSLHLDEKRSIIWLFILQVIWANVHGFFILGPILVLIPIFGELIKRYIPLPYTWKDIGRLSAKEFKHLQIIFVALLAACFVNPQGVHGFLYPLKVLFSLGNDSAIFFEHIVELQKPLNWHNFYSLASFPTYKLLIFFSGLSFVLNRKKLDVTALLLWLVFLLFSISAVRNIVFFAFAAYIVMLANIYVSYFEDKIVDRHIPSKRLQHFWALLFKVLLLIWMVRYVDGLALRGYFDYDKQERKSEFGGISLRSYPNKAVDFLQDNKIKGNFFNPFNAGAYILGRTSPDIKVFIDGRTELYGAEFFKDYNKMLAGDVKMFDEAIKKYNLTGAFFNIAYSGLAQPLLKEVYDKPDWVLVYFDYDAVIFLRNIPENQQWILGNKIDLIKYQTQKFDLLGLGAINISPYQYTNRANILYRLDLYDSAFEEVQEALRIAPDARAFRILGSVYLERKEYELAYEYLRKAKIMDPSDNEVHYKLGRVLYYLGDYQKALKHTNRVLAQLSGNSKALTVKALIQIKEEKYEEAFENAQSVYSSEKPKRVEHLLEIAQAFTEQNQYVFVEKITDQILKIEPDNKEVLNLQNVIHQGN